MSKTKIGGLDQYGANGPLNSRNLEQLALKGLNTMLMWLYHCQYSQWREL